MSDDKPMFDADEDTNPGMNWTDAEREKMQRIGGIAGYLAVCRDRMDAISGFNSVARGAERLRVPVTDDARCKGCGHLQSDHYRGPDPDWPSLESVYCDHEGCMCWERFAINRNVKGPLTPDRKPGRAP